MTAPPATALGSPAFDSRSVTGGFPADDLDEADAHLPGFSPAQEAEFIKALDIMAKGPGPELDAALAEGRNADCEGRSSARVLPVVIGAAVIVHCVYNAQDVIRNSSWNKKNAVFRLANIIANCVPAGASTAKVAKLIWKHRKRVAAALSTISLTASQAIAAAPRPS